MSHHIRIVSTLVLLSAVALPHSARAQDAAPKVSIVVHSADQVLADLKILLDLTTAKEQKQWATIKETIETFLPGIDTTKPFGIDVVLQVGDEQLLFALPMKNLKEFIKNNLGGFDINARKIAPSLYRLTEKRRNALKKKPIAYMRYRNRFVTIGKKRAEVNVVFDARRKSAPLLAKKLSLLATVKNKAGGEAARRKHFALIRENLLAALKAQKGEPAEELALRREVLVLELGEAERFLVESESLAMGFRIDPKTRQATLDIDLAAIANSDLDKSIHELAKTVSHFASVPRAASPILSFRIHHPLDEFRRGSLQVVLAATHKAIQADIKRTVSVTDAQKAASTKALDTIVAIIQSTLKKGHLDAFIEVSPVKAGANVMVAGIRTDQGQRLRTALAALPNSTLANDVKLDTATADDVTIHQLTVPARFHDEFVVIFGNSKTILVGTSPNAAWCAAGPGALEALKAALTARGTSAKTPPKPNPIFVDLAITLGPWLKAIKGHMKTTDDIADHKLALEAFDEGQDTVKLRLRRDGGRVVGSTTLGTGILRFLGKKLSQISKDNL